MTSHTVFFEYTEKLRLKWSEFSVGAFVKMNLGKRKADVCDFPWQIPTKVSRI